MTTYTTPHFATGPSDRNVRSDRESLQRARPAPAAATYRNAGVSDEAAVLADARTPDWQPAGSSTGVPKAAIGALGAALVGGIALAIVLMAPSNKVTKTAALPDPIAQATAQNAAAQKCGRHGRSDDRRHGPAGTGRRQRRGDGRLRAAASPGRYRRGARRRRRSGTRPGRDPARPCGWSTHRSRAPPTTSRWCEARRLARRTRRRSRRNRRHRRQHCTSHPTPPQ